MQNHCEHLRDVKNWRWHIIQLYIITVWVQWLTYTYIIALGKCYDQIQGALRKHRQSVCTFKVQSPGVRHCYQRSKGAEDRIDCIQEPSEESSFKLHHQRLPQNRWWLCPLSLRRLPCPELSAVQDSIPTLPYHVQNRKAEALAIISE